MEVILSGVGYGLLLAVLPGPVFFMITQTSVERGFRCAILVAAGVALSDSLYITISYLGISQITDNDQVRIYLANAGGIVLMLFGLYNLVIKSRKKSPDEVEHLKTKNPWRSVAKGFILNSLTPAVLLFWIGIVSVATSTFGHKNTGTALLFFSAIVITVFTTDVFKAKLADKLRHLLTPTFIQRLNIFLGVMLIIFGGRLLFFADVMV
jgi:threonine/homoserine/homoserine lactone efflux protein